METPDAAIVTTTTLELAKITIRRKADRYSLE
jgi:hypothetical protein